MKELKEDMIRHIRSFNKVLTEEFLNTLTIDLLLCEVHPAYYDYYKKLINDL